MADKEVQEDESQESGGKSKLIIIIVAVLVLLGGGGAAAFFLLAPSEPTDGEAAVEEVEVKAPARYVKMKPITVNFTEKNRQRFVQISPSLMSRDPDLITAIEENIPLIQNSFLLLFSSQKFADLKTRAGQIKLRKLALTEVQKVMQEEIGKDAVERVLFTGFIIQ